MAGQITGDIEGILARLQQVGEGAIKAVNDGMEAAMKKVQQEAIARAPVDTGDLENSIKIANAGLRKHWIVYVDDSVFDASRIHDPDYAMIMHESEYNLGPKSAAKAQSNNKPVGRKYLEGAFHEVMNTTMPDLQARLQEALRARGRL